LTVSALREIQNALVGIDGMQEVILDAVDEHIANTKVQPSDGFNDPAAGLVHWRLRVRTSLEEILVPDDISWMEDDATIPGEGYTRRVLDDIRDRFERCALILKYWLCYQS
jgi:hypothetical protein